MWSLRIWIYFTCLECNCIQWISDSSDSSINWFPTELIITHWKQNADGQKYNSKKCVDRWDEAIIHLATLQVPEAFASVDESGQWVLQVKSSYAVRASQVGDKKQARKKEELRRTNTWCGHISQIHHQRRLEDHRRLPEVLQHVPLELVYHLQISLSAGWLRLWKTNYNHKIKASGYWSGCRAVPISTAALLTRPRKRLFIFQEQNNNRNSSFSLSFNRRTQAVTAAERARYRKLKNCSAETS